MMATSEINPCPICSSENTRFLFDSWDFAHGYPGTFPLWECRKCKHVFLLAHFTPEMLSEMYSHYYPRADFDVEQFEPYPDRTGFLSWLDGDRASCHRWVLAPPPHPTHLNKKIRVLDIGCGYGEALGYHKAKGCEVWGCDADENIKIIAEKYGFNVHIGLFNPDNYEKDFFDYVTMNQVIEHFPNPETVIQQILTILKPGGKLIIATPTPQCIDRFFFGQYYGAWHTPYHLHLFSKRSMRLLLERTGYRFELSKCCIASVNLLNQWACVFVRGKPGKPTRFRTASWSHTKSFGNELERLWYVKLYRFLEKTRAFALPVRCADALGIGMNRIYIASKPSA